MFRAPCRLCSSNCVGVVAEDAIYWAAVAADRAGNTAAAKRRFSEFLVRFPASPRVEGARAALDTLR